MDRRAFLGLASGVRPAVADQALDVQILQTAASVEHAIIGAYEILLGLPILAGASANPLLRTLITTARAQHTEHAAAYNDVAAALGGRAQTAANPALAQTVARARPSLTDIGPAIDLALELEQAAAQTFQFDLGLLADVNARRLTGSVLAVESQHVGLLHLAKTFVAARALDLVSLAAGTLDRLPTDSVRTGFPEPFSPVDLARPAAEGAIR